MTTARCGRSLAPSIVPLRIVLALSLEPAKAIVRGHPRGECGRSGTRGGELPQNDTDIGARETIVGDGDG